MEIVYSNADYFKKILESLKVFKDEVNFQVNSNSLSCRFMDPSHIMMLKLELPKETFDEFIIEESRVFCLNLDSLSKSVFKNVSKKDGLRLRVDGDKAVFTFFSDIQRDFKTSLLEPEKEEWPEPKISFYAQSKIVLTCLERVLKDATNISDYLRISCTSEGLSFDAKGDYGEYHVTVDRNNENMLSIENRDRDLQKATYSLNFLNDLVKALKPLIDIIELNFSTNMPLMIKANLMQLGQLTFWLAPYKDDSNEPKKTEEPNEEPKEEIKEAETVVQKEEVEEYEETKVIEYNPILLIPVKVVFLGDFPEKIVSDTKTYGPYYNGEIDLIPGENAKILIEKGAAITLQSYRDARKKLLSVYPGFRGDITLEVLKPYIEYST